MGYAATIAADNPLNWWRCVEQFLPWIPNHGSLAQALSASAPVVFGATGPSSDSLAAYNPAGVCDWNSGSPTLTLGRPGSVELWFYQGIQINQIRWLFAWDGASAGNAGVYIDTTGKVQMRDPSGVDTASAAAISYAVWHHMVYTNDGATAKTYLDNVVVCSHGGQTVGSATQAVYVAGRAEITSQANLCIFSEVASYGAALSAAQVSAHYNAADLKATQPLNNLQGSALAAGGGPPGAGASLDAILRSVRKVY